MDVLESPMTPEAYGREGNDAQGALTANAVVFTGDKSVELKALALTDPKDGDVVVQTEVSGISMGTEKLFWSGDMPPFPGMGYPLVPGYETVGKVVSAPSNPELLGRRVFVPGARCFKDAHGLFGGSASQLVVAGDRVHPIDGITAEDGAMLSLAATAYHAVAAGDPPDLIVGFGVLGRLIRRITLALGHPAPTVWEINPARASAEGIRAVTAEDDPRRDYRSVYDVSGAAELVDQLIGRLATGGTVVLAGFYPGRISFNFAPAFIKEARLRIAAEWSAGEMGELLDLIRSDKLSLDGLISHQCSWDEAPAAYETAFTNPDCLKMLLDWRRRTNG